MQGDFSRDTFDPARDYSRVLMQQGRVLLDADWNEQTAILLHYLRTLARDLIGPHGGPADALGFELMTNGTRDLAQRMQAMEPDEARRKWLLERLSKEDAVIGTGRYYVNGILVENRRPLLYTEQVGYPFSEDTRLEVLQGKELLVYLDVWERHITHVQEALVREVALNGADTCSRAQVVWQVKVLVRGNHRDFGCKWLDTLLARARPPLLRARAQTGAGGSGPCVVAPESRYRGLENQLYRVEVHEVATQGNKKIATFKWSRENASVVFPLVSLSGTTAVVADLGRDQCSQLKAGDWVEVCDDVLAYRGQSGPLARVEGIDREAMRVTLKWPEGVQNPPAYTVEDIHSKHPLLRRWDHKGELAAHRGALLITESDNPEVGWIDLEDGVQVGFAKGGEYRPGDYWLIPARVATGDVEWPSERAPAGQVIPGRPAALPPHGPRHYYAPLYHVQAGGDAADCRCRIPARSCTEVEI